MTGLYCSMSMTTWTHKARGPRRVYSPPPAVLVWVNARSLHEVPVYIQRALLRGGGGVTLYIGHLC